jgi:acetylornithine deacetylase/succinyl-diaminopimelate desuccinylase-like protein
MTQFFAALDALDAAQIALGYDLKVIVDTEEELGSPHLSAAVLAHRDLLAADFLLVFDGPPHASNAPTVTLGARGITTMTLTTYGPKVPQHSGHYGNFLPNPAFDLARILASLKTPDGRVAIEGFYEGVTLTDEVGELLARVPDDEPRILADRGVAKPESVAGSLQEALQYPSLNIRGLSSAWVGKEARTIIPATAVAELDIRTVVESDPGHLVELVREHIRSLGFHVLDRAPTDQERLTRAPLVTMTYEISYGAFRSSIDSPAGLMARAGMRKLHGHEPILIRTMGGSVPIAPFVNALDIPAALVPTVNVDNNQHSPNENLRIGNFFDGIEILIAVLLSGPQ